MPLFDEDIFDSDVFDTAGASGTPAASPPRGHHWLVTLEVGGLEYRLATGSVSVDGKLYLPVIIDVSVTESSVDLDSRSVSPARASVFLTPDVHRVLSLRTTLPRAIATVAVLDHDLEVRTIVKSRVSDVQLGDGMSSSAMTGLVSSFQVVEEFIHNPLFPAKVADEDLLGKVRGIDGAYGSAYTEVFGDALCVPAFPIRKILASNGQQYLLAGHKLRQIPSADTSMPWDDFPNRGALTRDTVVGGWVAKNRQLRLAFAGSTFPAGLEVKAGSAVQGTSVVDIDTTSATRVIWVGGDEDNWTFIQPMTWRFNAQFLTTAGGGRRIIFYFGYQDEDNWWGIHWNASTQEVILVRNTTAGGFESLQTISSVVIDNAETAYRVDIRDGLVTVRWTSTTTEEEHTFDRVPMVTHGQVGFGGLNATSRWRIFESPAAEKRGATAGNRLNSIVESSDAAGNLIVVEEFDEEPVDDLYYDFREAQGVVTVPQLFDVLLREHSGFSADEIDSASFEKARQVLAGLRASSYFNDQAPIFEIFSRRLSPQFLVFVVQEGGLVRLKAVNPTGPAGQRLRRGKELLELDEPIIVHEKFTRFVVNYRFRANRDKFIRQKKLGPDQSPILEAWEDRHGRRDFPPVDLTDTIFDAVADTMLTRFATIFWQGETASYLREVRLGDMKAIGTNVRLTDSQAGYDDQLAILVGRAFRTQDTMVERYRTVHLIEGGA